MSPQTILGLVLLALVIAAYAVFLLFALAETGRAVYDTLREWNVT